ncbi:MAG: hypothetical protein JXA21_11125 [Anaerolineae bacterium]|nr:hypothetical protein [Anaerolineae bacterium]
MKTLSITGELDIIAVRMEVRNLARAVGFNVTDQACISLATSSLAHFLDLGGKYTGTISFGRSNGNPRSGLLVVCVIHCDDHGLDPADLNSKRLEKVRWMVDEMDIQALPSNNIQITLVKYLG